MSAGFGRGLLIAVLLSLVVWAAVGLLIWWLLGALS